VIASGGEMMIFWVSCVELSQRSNNIWIYFQSVSLGISKPIKQIKLLIFYLFCLLILREIHHYF